MVFGTIEDSNMSDVEGDVPSAAPLEAAGPMGINEAIQEVLKQALIADGLARGLREAAKALDKRQALLCILAENCDEPMYKKLVTALCMDAKQSLALVQGLGGLTESASKAISYQCLLEDFLDGSVNVHGPAGHGGSGGDISFNITHVDLLDVPSNLLVQ